MIWSVNSFYEGQTDGAQPSSSRPVSRRNRILSTNSEDEFFVGKLYLYSTVLLVQELDLMSSLLHEVSVW